MKIKIIAIGTLALTMLCSCSTKRSPLPYFEDIKEDMTITVPTNNYLPRIQPDDELFIQVLSQNLEATAAYNIPVINPGTRKMMSDVTTPQQQTYVVDSNGDITMPMIGKVHAAGLTTEQLRDKIIELVSRDVKDPEVNVRLVSFNVNVAGEVNKPGSQTVTTQRYSILDALSAAGDLTEYGERNNVLIVREENGKRVAHRINLNSSDLLESPYFYLQQNDYVYVTPNEIRQANSKYNQNNAFKVSVISTIVSGASVIVSLIIALTVK